MTYRRPTLKLGTFFDDQGERIDYGSRWRPGSPPDDTYSVTAHPERFAPLLEVARALREYLVATYDVDVDGDRIVPRDPAAASLTITETDFPLVDVRAGAAGHERFPQCGCDACDEDLDEMAEQLEHYVFAVVNGGFQEMLTRRDIMITWAYDEGNGSTSRMPRRVAERETIAAMKLAGRDKGAMWAPWSPRD